VTVVENKSYNNQQYPPVFKRVCTLKVIRHRTDRGELQNAEDPLAKKADLRPDKPRMPSERRQQIQASATSMKPIVHKSVMGSRHLPPSGLLPVLYMAGKPGE